MRTVDQIIHEDDWKSRSTYPSKWYNEAEIKVMLRKYAEECVNELWEDLKGGLHYDEWDRGWDAYNTILKEIKSQAIV